MQAIYVRTYVPAFCVAPVLLEATAHVRRLFTDLGNIGDKRGDNVASSLGSTLVTLEVYGHVYHSAAL